MLRRFKVLSAVCLIVVSVGCAAYRAPVIPPQGMLFTGIQAPLSTQFNEATPVQPTRGKASTTSILGLVAFGDASVATAARNGGLKVVNYADYEYLSVLFGLYSQFTVVVYGE